MTKLCPTLMDCYTVLKLYWVLTQFFQEAEPQPVWTSTPSNPLSAVESEDLTLSWSYNINGTLAYAKLFYIGDSQSKKLIALKPSVGSDINLDAAFQDRFFLNISDTQALVKIIAMQRSDKGTYRYEITNLDLVSISSDVEIIVLYAPNITEISGSREVNESDVLRLKCTADGDPTPNITWTKVSDNSTVFFPLTITGKQNEGLYRCTAQNGVGRPESSEVNITVENYHPIKTQLKTNLKNNTAVLNTTFNITCSAQANPPAKYRFYKGKGIVLEYVGMKSVGPYTAVVNNKEDHQVNYSCIAYNEYGNGLAQVATVSIQYPPSFTGLTIISGNTTVLHDTVISFNCSTDALPDAHMYEFYFNGNHIGNTSSGVLNTTVKVDGVYTCVPINTVGTGDKASVIITTVVPPSVEIFPQNATVVEGHNITLECNSPGKPGPVIIWTKVGRSEILSRRPSLVIMNVSRPGAPDNMIQYQCTASNGVGTPATATVNISVHFSPKIDHTPSVHHVVEGIGVILFCNATGNPQPNITWTKQGNNSELSTSKTLNLTMLTREDDGSVYKCTATNYVGSTEATIMVTVWFEPSVTSQQCSSPVTEGDNATLHCNATGNPLPSVAWIRASTRGIVSNSKMLFIANIKRNESGSYECLAWNGIGKNSTNSCTIDVHYLPTALAITPAPVNTTVLRGATVALTCKTDANPAAHLYHFYFDGNHIGNSSSGVFNVTVDKDGVYTCVPINTVGTGINATVSMTAVVAPSVEVSNTTLIVQEGSNIYLNCNASGKPEPSITWTKVDSFEVLSNTSSLTIMNVSRPGTPDNMIQYQCTASNGVESPATATVNVTVHFPPEIDHAPSVHQVVEGNGVILFCNATGNPQPNIAWTKQGNNSVLSTSETLNLTMLMREDDGSVYKCKVTNYIGSAEATTTVTVFFPPKSAIHECPSEVAEGDNVTLYCNGTGNPTPNIAWIHSGEVLSINRPYVISAINRSQAGLYECMAWNGIASNATTNCTVDVQYPPTSTIITTLTSNTTVLRGAAVSLICKTDANPEAHIYRFYFNGNLIGNSSSGVFNVTTKAGGEYTCVSINTVGAGDNATVRITTMVAPSAEVITQTETVIEGGNISLTCNVSGVPAPTVLWTQIGSSNVLSQSSSVTIVNVSRPGTPDNMIQYQCTASNGVESPATDIANVTVLYNSVIYQAPSSTVVLEGSNLTLYCNATGNPTPNITWTKDGSSTVLYQGEMYSIVNIQRQAAGDYKCTAWNGVGEQKNATATVTVHYPAEMVTGPVDQVVWVGEHVTLVCNAAGNPAPNISYSVVGENGTIGNSTTLVIGSSNVAYVKIYTCTANNGIQQPAIANVTVTVLVRPCSLSPCMKGSCTDVKTPAYQCQCDSGYQGRNCDEPIPQETDIVKGEVELKKDKFQYHADYRNHSSKMFKDLSSSFKDNVTTLYKDVDQFGHVRVQSILNGSVVVNFTLVFLKGNKTVGELVQILQISVYNGTVNSIPVERGTLHLILPTIPATATVIPPSVAAQRKKLKSWMVALLGGIGGLIFLVLVCAIIHCCVHSNRKARKEDIRQGYEDETGRWIDLPHIKNGGIKPAGAENGQTNPALYVEEGPSTNELLYQERAVQEEVPEVRTVPGEKPETNGNSTHL